MNRFGVLYAACVFASVADASTELSRTRYRDETARLEYSWVENCTNKQLTVSAARTKVGSDGITALTGPVVSVSYSTYTFCDLNNPVQTFWFGTTENATLQLDANLRAASLNSGSVTLQGQMFKGGQQTALGTTSVSLSVTWSSNDAIDKYAGTIVTRYPGYHEVNHLTGLYRTATATGTISDGVTNWFPAAPEGGLVRLYRLNQAESILIKD